MDRETYKSVADNFHNARANPYLADKYIKAARDVIVNLNSDGDGTPVEVKTLYPLYEAFLQIREFFQDEPRMLAAVRAINNYVVDNYSDGLSDFVNSVSWDDYTVPYYWKSLSTNAGFDTSDWI